MTTRVLVVEDDEALREALCVTLSLAGYEALAAADGPAALELAAREPLALVVSDVQMAPMDGLTLLHRLHAERPELPVLLMTAYATVQQAVQAMRQGAVDYLMKPFEAEVLVAKVAQYALTPPGTEGELVAADPMSRELVALSARVAESEATVLISGESGTGKEVLARFIHRHSQRAAGPFVAVNCAAIPENMLEALLFGYEKGAFTGAYRSSPGKFEQAQGGTLLLDEVSEMSLALQAKLLRVPQEREVERLGGQGVIPLDVRVLATTNRDLKGEVAAGRFREDLYYRVNVFPIRVPPLRARPGDIVPLAEHLLGEFARGSVQPVPRLDGSARALLMDHPWPGNVRELGNVLQRALILARGGLIREAELCFEVERGFAPAASSLGAGSPPAPDAALGEELRERERSRILSVLDEEGGNRTVAAARLGISPRTLRHKLQRMREAGASSGGA